MDHVIVLAGGEGKRLEGLARARYGYARPKQFCDFGGGATLLDQTLSRAVRLVAPDRVLVVTTAAHRADADEVLSRWPTVRRIEQPVNRDTLPGLTLPVLSILTRDPHARLIVLPSDHAVDNHDAFVACLARALEAVPHYPFELLLLGAQLGSPEDGYGWILPADRRDGFPRVAAFREKPPMSELVTLMDQGALANTFVMLGDAWSFAELVLRQRPDWFNGILNGLTDPTLLDRAYATLAPSNFSEAVLEPARSGLRVVAMPEVGWSDVGTPERLERSMPGAAFLRRPAAPPAASHDAPMA